ncbi:MAG: YncE family protein [Gammaproteobacteria bacterium]|nr:YncE family protein [Gammaproteobacteria bacterium]
MVGEQGWVLVSHIGDGSEGMVSIVKQSGDEFIAIKVPVTMSPKAAIFLGMDGSGNVTLMDPVSKEITSQKSLPMDAFPAYAYRDTDGQRIWFMNDGDKKSGCDEINCGLSGSSVTVIQQADDSPALEKVICVGRGHHVTAFTAPSESAPDVPRHAFVSNLKDGTISVLGHDPKDGERWLKVINTINLYDASYDEGGSGLPNGAFPHGMEYSSATGKLYCLNNGYATISVIDPVQNKIESTIEMSVSSNLLLSPDGHFIIGKGADRKADNQHVIGRLSVVDVVSQKVISVLDLPDIYPSTYRFNPDGSKLYVTTAATGKGEQRDNLKKSQLLIFDTSNLPEMKLIKEVDVGEADCGRRPISFLKDNNRAKYVFVPNPTDGTLTILSGADDTVLSTVSLGKKGAEFSFSFFGEDRVYGA